MSLLTSRALSLREQSDAPLYVIGALVLIVLEFSPLSILLLLATLTAVICFGSTITTAAGFTAPGIGISFVVGAGCLVFGGQALIHSGISPTIAHPTILVLMFAFSMIASRNRPLIQLPASLRLQTDALFSISVAVLAFGLRHPWALPFAISVALYERLSHRMTWRGQARARLWLLVLACGVTALALRPDRWWYLYLTGDTGFFESIGWSTSHWGAFREHPGRSGGSMTGYHWLSYSLLGSFSHLALLEPFEALTKLGPLLPAAILASTIRRSLGKVEASPGIPSSWIVPLLIVVGSAAFRFDSESYGIAVCLVLISLVIEYEQRSLCGWRPLLIFVLLVATAIMSKASAALALCALIAAKYLIDILLDRRTRVTIVATFALSGALTYFVFLSGSNETGRLLDFSLRMDQRAFVQMLIATPYLSWGVFFVVGVVVYLRREQNVLPAVSQRFLIASCITAMALSLLSVINGYMDLLMKPAQTFVILIVALIAVQALSPVQPFFAVRRRILVVAVSTSFMVGFGLPVATNRVNRALGLSNRFGDSLWELLTYFAPYILIAAFAAIPWLKDGRQFTGSHLMLVLALLIACISGLQIDRARRVATWGPEVAVGWTMNDSAMSSDDLREVGAFIRNETSENVILATNDFCCFGEGWWTDIAKDPEGHRRGSSVWWSQLQSTEWWTSRIQEFGEEGLTNNVRGTLFGGDNYLLAAEARRRVLMQGLKFQVVIPDQNQIDRMSVSLRFANSPSTETVRKLKDFGVSGYVVNLSLTNYNDWSAFATERFRSGDYVFLELR